MARRKVLGEQLLTVYELTYVTVNGKRQAVIQGAGIPWFANVDPITGWRVTTLPEGDRDKRNLYLHSTDIELRGPNQQSDTAGHIVVYRGEQYMVRDVMHYDRVLPHSEYRVTRVSSPIPVP